MMRFTPSTSLGVGADDPLDIATASHGFDSLAQCHAPALYRSTIAGLMLFVLGMKLLQRVFEVEGHRQARQKQDHKYR